MSLFEQRGPLVRSTLSTEFEAAKREKEPSIGTYLKLFVTLSAVQTVEEVPPEIREIIG